MTAKTRAQLESAADVDLADNNVGAITESKLRQIFKDLVDSNFNTSDDKASEADAEAAAVNDKVMTPIRVKNYVDLVMATLAAIATSGSADDIDSGTLADAHLSANVLLMDTDNVISGRQHFDQLTSTEARSTTAWVRRHVDADSGLSNPKALRVNTIVEVSGAGTAQKEYAVSGEVEVRENAGVGNAVAVSGTSFRKAASPGALFALHGNAVDEVTYGAATDVVATHGLEININAVGLDHPTANDGSGNRQVALVIAKSFDGAAAEIGTGVRVVQSGEGYFRRGVAIEEGSSANPMTTGLHIDTTGADGIVSESAHTTADIRLEGNSPVGLMCSGSYSDAAIRVNAGQKIALNGTASVALKHDSGDGEIDIMHALVERFNFGVESSPYIKLAGTKVLDVQQSAIADHASDATVNEILAALRAHGLIAT